MPGRERRHHINSKHEGVIVRIVLTGPKENQDELIKAANKLNFENISKPAESVPWKNAFSEYPDEQLPGVILVGARHKEGFTQKQLADRLGIKQGYISDMERGKRSVGKEMAKRLGKILNVSYKIFL